jgi:hypothetical protein
MSTKTAVLPYDLNRARSVGPETEKTGEDTHTTATSDSTPQPIPLIIAHSETRRSGGFPSHS